jgi:aspartate aminotransferase-like enzyme
MKQVFKTAANVVIFPASGTGAWEAALVNTLSPGTGLGKVQVPFNKGGVDAALDYLANNP